MEAKDVKWCPQHGYPLPCGKCGMSLTQSQQTEIYQAGMKVVIKWVNIRMFGNSDGYIFDDDPTFSLTVFHKQFQAQLKVWKVK